MSVDKIKVLLIDGSEDVFIWMRGLLSQLPNHIQYDLQWINNFEQGVSAAVRQQADVYLVDYNLGLKTGLDLLKEAEKSAVKQPLILLHTKNDHLIDQQAMTVGAANYLIKTEIDASSLDRAIRYALNHALSLKALKESENKYKVIFERAKDAILISDYTGKIHNINHAGLLLFGYSSTEMLHTSDRELFYNVNDREDFIQSLETKGALQNFECQMLTKDGRILFCQLSSFLQIDTVNMIEVYHTIIHNVGSRITENQDLKQSSPKVTEKLALKFADNLRSELSFANITLHELASSSSVLKDKTAKKSVDELKTSCEKINAITENYIVASTSNLDSSASNINLLIQEFVKENTNLLSLEDVTVNLDILKKEIMVKMNKPKIREALGRILKNAVESMGNPPKKISISAFSDSGFYSILIEDCGEGIPNENKFKIFYPGFSTKPGHIGMGLTDAQKIILEHNGSIEYRKVDHGSLFVITLPIAN